jgi:general secretion pathway protein B
MMRPADQHPVATGRNPLMEEAAVEPPPMADAVASGAATPPRGPPAVQSDAPVRPGRVIYESLPEAGRVTSPPGAVAADGATSASKLPRADEIAARLGSPELRLELHVYSTRPAERMVFINSRQYHEGDTTQEGALVEQITPDGVVLSMNGSRFLLARE